MKDLYPLIKEYIGNDYTGLITPELVLAIIKVESNFNSSAVRYEPNYTYLVSPHAVKPVECSYRTEIELQKMSWGLMQVMGAVAREYGFRGWLTRLLSPDHNIYYGITHLKMLEKRGIEMTKRYRKHHYGLNDLISDYNDGDWRKRDNVLYISKVKKAMADYEKQYK